MKNILFPFASQFLDSANQMIDQINDLTISDNAILTTIIFAGLVLFMFYAFRSLQVSTLRSFLVNNRGQGAMEYLMTYGWAILVVMIVGVVLWQLGVFNVGQGNLVTTGFVKMQPLTPSVAYRNNNFTVSFMNALGTTIKLKNITLNESISRIQCTGVTPTPAPGISIKAGGTFTVVSATGCPPKADGESYDLVVVVQYTAVMGGVATNHTDTGHIKGQGEA